MAAISRHQRKLARAVGRAIADFAMIADGDRILCAVSGGKDSYVMHELLADLGRRAPVRFELWAVNIDQGHPGYPGARIAHYMAERGHRFQMLRDDTYSVVKAKVPEGQTACPLCSRLRRAILYRAARALGCNKVALGHHRDDIVVTLMLNLIFVGQLKAMPPKLVNDAGDLTVIRPLCYCAEEDIAALASERSYPIVPCGLCRDQPGERRLVGELLAELERRYPGARASMLTALGNVRPSQLLDVRLWRALGLAVARELPDDESAAADERVALRRAKESPSWPPLP